MSVVLLILSLVGVFVLSGIHPSQVPDIPRHIFGVPSDLVAHFGMYAVLGAEAALVLTLFGMMRRYPLGSALFAIVVVSGYGLLMEAYQGLLPHRYSSWADAAANTMGAAVGVSFVAVSGWLAERWRSRRREYYARAANQ